MQCNVCVHSCTTRWIPTCPSLLSPLPFIANFLLVLDELHCTWFRSMITMYLATRPKLAIIGQTVRIEEKCRLWKIPMKMSLDHRTQFQESQQPRRPQIRSNKMCNTFVHRWTMRRNAAVPPRFVLYLEGASLPWEKILGGGGEQSLTYKDDHMVYWRRLRIWPTSVQHAT